MAAIQCRNGSYRIPFRHAGKQRSFTPGEVFHEEAEGKAAQIDYLLLRLKQRLAVLPPGVEIVEYIQYDGKIIPPESMTKRRTCLIRRCNLFRDTTSVTWENFNSPAPPNSAARRHHFQTPSTYRRNGRDERRIDVDLGRVLEGLLVS